MHLSLSQTLSGWQLIENRAMLLCHEGCLQAYSRDATVVGRRADYEAVAFSDCLHKILLLGRTFWQFGCKMRERLKVHTGEKPRTGAEPFKLRQDSAADALAGGGLSSRTPEPHNHR